MEGENYFNVKVVIVSTYRQSTDDEGQRKYFCKLNSTRSIVDDDKPAVESFKGSLKMMKR